MNTLKVINESIFSLFLFIFAWQDWKTKSVSVWLLAAAGLAGVILSFLQGTFGLSRLISCLPGAGLLLLSRLTDEAVGAGDGLFFIVSGLFLNTEMNFGLLIYGILLNGLSCGGIYFCHRFQGKNAGKKTIPFLPFLIPVWIGLVIL